LSHFLFSTNGLEAVAYLILIKMLFVLVQGSLVADYVIGALV
jgi:hypothetical protein